MARKSTGKRTRFEVFKRDSFTCQYCGAQPPEVVLVCDHIHPVALGGETTLENLITACEACNQGKADKPLTATVIRPDADLLYLEAQQEIAELRRHRAALAEREAAIAELLDDLAVLWTDLTGGDWSPADHILRQMLAKYGPEAVTDAIEVVAPKIADGWVKKSGWVQYTWSVLRNQAEERAS